MTKAKTIILRVSEADKILWESTSKKKNMSLSAYIHNTVTCYTKLEKENVAIKAVYNAFLAGFEAYIELDEAYEQKSISLKQKRKTQLAMVNIIKTASEVLEKEKFIEPNRLMKNVQIIVPAASAGALESQK